MPRARTSLFTHLPSPGALAKMVPRASIRQLFGAALGVFLVVQNAPAASEHRKAAERSLASASATLSTNTTSVKAGWEFARACFDLAEYATNNAERANLAKQGIEAARRAIALDPASAPAHYYLGMNVGQLARTKFLGALKLVNEIEREFLRARDLDPRFDYAGPDRSLGLLYRDAPSLGSVGSRHKAQIHMQNAVKLAPGYPDNGLNLAESFLGWGDRNEAARELKALEGIWAEAKTRFTGPAWESSWADWESRRARVSERIREGSTEIKSPHDK